MASSYNSLMLVAPKRRGGKRRRNPAFKDRERIMHTPDPRGRLDVALARLLDLAVDKFADPMVKQLYPALRDDVARVIGAATGPRTAAGKFARKAVGAVQLAQAISQRNCGNNNNTGGAA